MTEPHPIHGKKTYLAIALAVLTRLGHLLVTGEPGESAITAAELWELGYWIVGGGLLAAIRDSAGPNWRQFEWGQRRTDPQGPTSI